MDGKFAPNSFFLSLKNPQGKAYSATLFAHLVKDREDVFQVRLGVCRCNAKAEAR